MNVTAGCAPIKMPAAAFVPWIACLVIAWLLTGVTSLEWLGFVICVALASMVYMVQRAASRRVRTPAA